MSIRALSFALLSSVLPVVAQEPAAAAPKPAMAPSTVPGAAPLPKPAPKSVAKPAADDATSVTLAFAGGTLAAFCDQLRSLEFRPNIVVAPLAAEAKLPAMSLRGAGIEEALSAACAIAASESQIFLKGFHGAGEPVFTILAKPSQGEAPVASAQPATGDAYRELRALSALADQVASAQPATGDAYRLYDSRLTTPPSPRSTDTRVFSLNALLAGVEGVALPVETILMALEVALDDEQAKELHAKGLAPASSATLRFHKDSGLLIVRGSPLQLALATEALACLEADLPELVKRHAARPGAASEPAKTGK